MIAPDATGILVTSCSLVPLLILGAFLVRAHKRGRKLRATVLALTLLHETVLVAFPGWYSALTGFSIEGGNGVTPDQMLTVYFGEAMFVTLFACGMILAARGHLFERMASGKNFARGEQYFIGIVLIGASVAYVGKLLAPSFTAQDIATHWQITVRTDLLENLRNWSDTLFQWPGLIAAAMVVSEKSISRAGRLLGAVILTAQLIYAMLYGLRGGIVYVLCLTAAAGYYANRKRMLVYAALMTAVLVPMFPWLHSTMRYMSYSAGAGTSRFELLPLLVRNLALAAGSGEARSSLDEFIESWAVRAEGPRNSNTMYQMYDSNEAAGYMPILGAMVLPVPRMWWVEKPVAGSTDATNLGAAIYRVQQKRTAFYDMGPVLASAHAYWEGGPLWLILAGVASGWMWECLFLWAERAGRRSIDIMVLTMVAALPVDGFFSALNPVFTYIRLFWIAIIPLSALMFLLRRIPRVRRAFTHSRGVAQAGFQSRVRPRRA